MTDYGLPATPGGAFGQWIILKSILGLCYGLDSTGAFEQLNHDGGERTSLHFSEDQKSPAVT